MKDAPDLKWEVDIFEGDNAGLVVAALEMPSHDYKFERRALHALGPLSDFDTVIVDSRTPEDQIRALRLEGVNVVVAPDIGASAL